MSHDRSVPETEVVHGVTGNSGVVDRMPMRVAYVCRDLAGDRLTRDAAAVCARARADAATGHRVHLVSESLAGCRDRSPGLVHAPVGPVRPDHRYLAESHAYADRVYHALRTLHAAAPLDAVEFVDAGGEGFTTIRAKRLLDEFGGVRLRVAVHPWAALAPGEPAATLDQTVTRHLEAYCRRYADETVEPATRPDRRPPENAHSPGPVWFLGDARPESGLAAVAAALALPGAPGSEILVWGGVAVAARDRHAVTPADGVRLAGPSPLTDLVRPPPAGTVCVLAAGDLCPPASAYLAMAMGLRVIAFAGSTAADIVAERGGTVVPPGDPVALRDALSGRQACSASVHLGQSTSDQPSVHLRQPSPPDPAPADPGKADHQASVREPDLVTVVIPIRNQGRYLPGAVTSARHCGYQPVEVVVVDDGSNEPETVRILGDLAGVRLLRGPHRGLPAARNAGLAAARGRYVVPLDADDLLPAGFVGPAVVALQRDPSIGCVGGSVRNFGLLDHVGVPVGYVPDISLVVNTFPRATAVFRAAAIVAAGGYDTALPAYEDWDLYLRLHKAGYAVECAPVVGQLYRRHEASMTFQRDGFDPAALTQYLLRRHADLLADGRSLSLLLTLVDLWKSGYEPSASAVWRTAHAPIQSG